MATETRWLQDLRQCGTLNDLNPPSVDRERMLAEVELHQLSTNLKENCKAEDQGQVMERLHALEDQIRGNMEALDYLRGISGLEKPFTNLLENVLHAALVLSRENSVSKPQIVYDPGMNEKIDRCWNYIVQLTDVVRWHVTHAVRYHKFHHHLKSAQMDLQHMNHTTMERLEQLVKSRYVETNLLKHLEREIGKSLKMLTKLNNIAHELHTESRMLTPLHRRRTLLPGPHTAHALASIRLPDGSWIHRGEKVKVSVSSQVASDLLHEWQVETMDAPSRQATLPSSCLWLDSPEISPTGSVRDRLKQNKLNEYPDITQADQHTDFAFSNCKTLVLSFQLDLLVTWEKLMNKIRQMVLPTYRDFVRKIVESEEAVATSNPKRIKALLQNMRPLMGNENPEDLVLLADAQSREFRFTENESQITKDELGSLTSILTLWTQLKEQLSNAREATLFRPVGRNETENSNRRPNGISQECQQESSASTAVSVESNVRSQSAGCGTIDELITSFADPTPRTFQVSVVEQAAARLEHILPETEAPVHLNNHNHDQLKTKGSTTDTRDLMTQITTPFFPTLVHCPNCSLPYEVDVYESAFEAPIYDWDAGSRSSSVMSPIIPERTQQEDSTVTLTTTGNKSRSKEHKKLFHFSRKRTCSLNRTDAADSSGIGSSPDPVSMELGERIRERRELLKCSSKHNEIKKKPFHSPAFHWGKRSKSKVQSENDISQTNLSQSEADASPNHQTHSTSVTLLQPTLRSRSWLQRGTPWGYGPPLHDHWRKMNVRMSHELPETDQLNRWQLHNEQMTARAIRPRLTTEYFRRAYFEESAAERRGLNYGTIDSGVQNNAHLEASGISQLIQVDLLPVVCPVEGTVTNDAKSVMSVDMLREKRVLAKKLMSSEYSQTTNERQQDSDVSVVPETWDVSCQIGVIHRDHAASADMYEPRAPITPKHDAICVTEIQGELKISKEGVSATKSNSWQEHPPIYYSVACQVGKVSKDIAVGLDVFKAVHTLDQSTCTPIETEEAFPPFKQQTDRQLIGKKLQVGTSFCKHDEGLPFSRSLIDACTSPIEDLIPYPSRFVSDNCTQTVDETSIHKIAFSASTLIGQVLVSVSQQTEPFLFQIPNVDDEQGSIQTVGTPIKDSLQISASTRIRSAEVNTVIVDSEMANSLRNCDIANTTRTEPAVTPVLIEDVSQSITESGMHPETCNMICPNCDQVFLNKPKVQTRSKRIQKGPSAFIQNYASKQTSSETDLLPDKTGKQNTMKKYTKSSTTEKRSLMRRRHQHLIVDIGLYQDGEGKEEYDSRRQGRNPSYLNDESSPRHNRAASSSSSLDTIDSVRLCFRLDPGTSWKTIHSHKVVRGCQRGRFPKRSRSWSMDDFRAESLAGYLTTERHTRHWIAGKPHLTRHDRETLKSRGPLCES